MSDEYYKSKWKSIVNVMSHSGFRLSRIAKAGSRAIQQHGPKSDMDVIYSIAGNPSKQVHYPQLERILRSNFPHDRVEPGSNYNVVHVYFQSGGKFDLVLLKDFEFDRQHEDDVNYRRTNL